MTGKLMPDASLNPTSLVVGAIANAFALSSVLYIAWEISGGHVNPAVTFAMAVGGHISVPTALFYWVAQLIASVIACLFLKVIVVGMVFFLPFFSSTSLFKFLLVLT
jgi:aquaporin TIP